MKGKFNHFALTLGGLALFAASSPALAAKSVSVTVNPTTGYFEATPSTYRVPPGVKMSPVKDVSTAVVEKLPGGGLSQSISSGIEITALKQSAPVQGRFTAGLAATRNAAARCFKSARCNLAFTAGAIGLQTLLDSVDWVMTEGSQISKKEVDFNLDSQPDAPSTPHGNGSASSSTLYTEFPVYTNNGIFYAYNRRVLTNIHSYWSCSYPKGMTKPVYLGSFGDHCYWGPTGSDPLYSEKLLPVDSAEVEDVILSTYEPDASDLRWLSPGFDLGHSDVGFEITSAPSLQVPPKTTTKYDASGNPVEVQETNIWHDFSPVDNPSKQPGLDQNTTEETKTYDSTGNMTGSSSTTTNNNASNSTTTVEAPEMPIDCDLMPTLCEWMDWTKTGWEENQETEFEERDFFGDEVPSFSDSLQSISEGIGNSPISQAINSIQFPSSGICPTGSITISVMGYAMPLVFESHCDIWESIGPIISAAFLALWALVAVRVFLSA